MQARMLLSGIVLPSEPLGIDAGSLYAQLATLSDPRDAQGKRYALALIVTLILLAKLAGEKTMSGIAQWARLRQAWLASVLCLPCPSLPCANPYTNVCAQLDVAELKALLATYFVTPLPALPADRPLEPVSDRQRAQQHLVRDGKTRGGRRRGGAGGTALRCDAAGTARSARTAGRAR